MGHVHRAKTLQSLACPTLSDFPGYIPATVCVGGPPGLHINLKGQLITYSRADLVWTAFMFVRFPLGVVMVLTCNSAVAETTTQSLKVVLVTGLW